MAGSVGDLKIEELGFVVTTRGESLSCEQSNERQELNLHVGNVDEERESTGGNESGVEIAAKGMR